MIRKFKKICIKPKTEEYKVMAYNLAIGNSQLQAQSITLFRKIRIILNQLIVLPKGQYSINKKTQISIIPIMYCPKKLTIKPFMANNLGISCISLQVYLKGVK